MKPIIHLAVALACVLYLTGCTRDPRLKEFNITGTITDLNGNPLEDVDCSISYFTPAPHAGAKKSKKNFDHDFKVNIDSMGIVVLEFSKDGYVSNSITANALPEDSNVTEKPDGTLSYSATVTLTSEKDLQKLGSFIGELGVWSDEVKLIITDEVTSGFRRYRVTTNSESIIYPYSNSLVTTGPAIALDLKPSPGAPRKFVPVEFRADRPISPRDAIMILSIANPGTSDGLIGYAPKEQIQSANQFPSQMSTTPEHGYEPEVIVPIDGLPTQKRYYYVRIDGIYAKLSLTSWQFNEPNHFMYDALLVFNPDGSRNVLTGNKDISPDYTDW